MLYISGSYGGYAQQRMNERISSMNRIEDPRFPVPNRGSLPGSYPKDNSRGQKRGLGQGNNSNRKRPRFDEFSIEKDDSKIPVDKTIIDKKFNFWNLPSKARVLLVSNIPLEIAKPKPLFYLFSMYGDIPKIKILPRKLNAALIEFSTATMACIARNNLDQVEVMDKKLFVSFSKYHEIQQFEDSEANFIVDFTAPEYKLVQRFSKKELIPINLRKISKPMKCVHINNFNKGFTVSKAKALLAESGITAVDIVGIKKLKEKDVSPDTPSRAYIFVDFKDISDATLCLALIGGATAGPPNPAGMRISFCESSVEAERTKNEADKKMVVVGMDDPL